MAVSGVIPVYINNFNLLTWPRQLAGYFDNIRGTTVIFVDNCSTYPPLLEWYERDCPYRVLRLNENLGHHGPWKSGAVVTGKGHRARYGSEYYAVTDPDLSLEPCPQDLLELLATGLQRYPAIVKAGLSLEINDIPHDSMLGARPRHHEMKFWKHRIDPQFFEAGVDTTFALYSIHTPRHRAMCGIRPAIRSDRPYTARHCPWYLTENSLTDELLYYFKRVRLGHWGSIIARQLGEREQTGH